MFPNGFIMAKLEPKCKIINVYRKDKQNWIQFILCKTKKPEDLSAQDLLMKHKNLLAFFSQNDIISITMLAQNQAIPIIEIHTEPRSNNLFCILLTIQMSILIASNIMSSKVMHVLGVDIVAGAICFPVIYSISDIFVEIYGFKTSRKAMMCSILGNSIMVLLIYISVLMTPAATWHHQEAYALIHNSSSRIYFASMMAFACGDLMNSYLLAKFKENIFRNRLFVRLVFACLIGLFIDSIIFVTVAHIDTLPFYSIINMLLNVLFHKFIYEIFTAIILVYIIKHLKKRFQDLKYQPLTIKFL